MKIFDKTTEIESIEVIYRNGKHYSIWKPREVDIALKLHLSEDEDGDYTEDDLNCTFDLHGVAKWDNINTVEV